MTLQDRITAAADYILTHTAQRNEEDGGGGHGAVLGVHIQNAADDCHQSHGEIVDEIDGGEKQCRVVLGLVVAVVALAPGTVAELQLGIGDICSAADCTAVGIRCFGSGFGRLIRTDFELDDFSFLDGFLFKQTAGIDPPGQGKYVQHICSKEQEIVCQGNNGKAVIGERIYQEVKQHQYQIKQGEDPCLYRDDKE